MADAGGPPLLDCDELLCGSRASVADFRALTPTKQWSIPLDLE